MIIMKLSVENNRSIQLTISSVQLSKHQRHDSLMQKNPIHTGTVEPLSLETDLSVYNFTCAKVAMVSPKYLY